MHRLVGIRLDFTGLSVGGFMGKYDDIINLEYVKSKRHPHMSRLDRAAQFAPFAALTGHEETIDETAKNHKVNETEREKFFD